MPAMQIQEYVITEDGTGGDAGSFTGSRVVRML